MTQIQKDRIEVFGGIFVFALAVAFYLLMSDRHETAQTMRYYSESEVVGR